MKYLVTVLGTNKDGLSYHTDLYYTTKKPLNTQERIEEMREKAIKNIQGHNPEKGLVILNIFGPFKE
jgi:hypothetical protein